MRCIVFILKFRTRRRGTETQIHVIPLFDTNIFVHLVEGRISPGDWRRVIRLRPARGWPASAITVLELLVGIHGVAPEDFDQAKKQLRHVWELSRGRVLDEPRVLLCRDLFHANFPYEPISAGALSKLTNVVCLADTLDDLREARVSYKSCIYHAKRKAGVDTRLISDLMIGPKRDWIRQITSLLTDIYPEWRTYSEKTQFHIPPDLRRRLEPSDVWLRTRHKFSESILEWLRIDGSNFNPAEFAMKIDAVISFTIWVLQESLLRKYAFENHESDIYDQFQLHYLANENYVFVTNDKKLRGRTASSAQAGRILSFDQFLRLDHTLLYKAHSPAKPLVSR